MAICVTDFLFMVIATILVQDVCGKVLYHYTDEKGSDQIFKSGYLKRSTSGAFGAGVYLTSFSPLSKSRKAIATNNWAAATASSLAKTKCVFEVEVSGAVKQDSSRDIYLYTDEDIVFKDINDWNLYDWAIGTSAKVVRGKNTKQCFTKTACVQQNFRLKRSASVSIGTAGFTTCSGKIFTGNTLAIIISSIVVFLLHGFTTI